VIFGGKWQGIFGTIWLGGLVGDSAGAAAEHLPWPRWRLVTSGAAPGRCCPALPGRWWRSGTWASSWVIGWRCRPGCPATWPGVADPAWW